MSAGGEGAQPPARLAVLLCRLRWLVVAAWVAGAVVAGMFLPTIEQAGTGALGALIPKDADAVKAEIASKTEFGFPLLSRTLLVERDPHGLSAVQQARVVRHAAQLTRGRLAGFDDVAGAIPLTNALGRPPFSRERSTTAITYLFFRPAVSARRRKAAGERLAGEVVQPPAGTFAGVTGQAPARATQADAILGRLPLVELATVVLVAAAVGLRFRAVGAPLVTLVAVGVAYEVATRLVAGIGKALSVSVPQEVEPVIVVLLFGVVTDYSVFFLSRFRALLGQGLGRLPAARRTAGEVAPIVFVAGITVAAAATTLLVAELDFFRAFGPGLAISLLIALSVSMTLIPALLAIAGRWVFWPRRLEHIDAIGEEPSSPAARPRRTRAVRFACGRPVVAVILCLIALGGAASGIARLHLADPVIRGLPAGATARVAYEQGAKGFAPGVLSPSVIVVSAPGIARHRGKLARLQRALARRHGVALVLGPAEQPVKGVRLGATVSSSGDAARYFLVLNADPLGARAIGTIRRIEAAMPRILRRAGLAGAHVGFAGDTALSAETIDKTNSDLVRIAPAALAVIFLILAIYLRALVAPLYLVAASVVAFVAALGLSTYVFQSLLGFGGLTYFAPFVAAVLLVSLGSDYNVFLVGRVWQEAQRRPLADAIPEGASRAASAITLAGLVLAGSFALLLLVPIRSFAEVAVTMALGLLLDAFVVRTILAPALMTLAGPLSGWPGGRLTGRSAPPTTVGNAPEARQDAHMGETTHGRSAAEPST